MRRCTFLNDPRKRSFALSPGLRQMVTDGRLVLAQAGFGLVLLVRAPGLGNRKSIAWANKGRWIQRDLAPRLAHASLTLCNNGEAWNRSH